MEFLKQDWSGRVYVKTDVLAQRKDMEPYEFSEPVLVVPVDLHNMDKEKLGAYAMDEFGVDLNKRKSLKNLVKEVEALMETHDGNL